MRTVFSKVFLAHPATVEETYFEHLMFAGRIAITLIAAGIAAFIHALIPCLFKKTAGNLIRKMHSKIEGR